MSSGGETLSRPGRRGIPLADIRALRGTARRTRLLQLGLAAVLLGTLVLAIGVVRGAPVQHSSFFPAGGSGIVVIDFSTSIGGPAYQRITNVLRPVIESNQPIGVVYFSDVAYLALPPGTPGRELRPFLRFLRTPPPLGAFPTEAQRQRAERRLRTSVENPWSAAFRGGTRISTGLELARQVVERDGIDGTVLLLSDLDDSLFDLELLGDTLARFRRDGIDLRVVPLFPSPDDRKFFLQTLGPQAFVSHAELLRNARSVERRSLQAAFPLEVVLLVAGLLVLVALNEVACRRLEWRRA
jgi:hypothetical protein